MTRTEAEKLATEYKSLKGEKFKNHLIDYLLVVPDGYDKMNELMVDHQNEKSNSHILDQFTDFDVWVISQQYDLADVHLRDRLPLSEVLRQLKRQ